MTRKNINKTTNPFSRERIEKDRQKALKIKALSANSKIGYFKKQKNKIEEDVKEIKSSKIFVLDTNVFVHDPDCLFVFKNNDIVIPMICLRELDGLKNKTGTVGYSARESLRKLDTIFNSQNRKIECAAKIDTNLGFVFLIKDNKKKCIEIGLDPSINDDIIISTVYSIMELNPEKDVVFVTRDKGAKLKALALGLKTEDYENDKTTTFEVFGDIYEPGQRILNKINSVRYQSIKSGGYFKIIGDKKERVLSPEPIFGISPRNKEQECILDALLDDDIKIVAVSGPAGTGKTMLALLAGLFQTIDTSGLLNEKTEEDEELVKNKKTVVPIYDKILFTRAIIPVGEDIGFLPGDKNEKFGAWMDLVSSNVEFVAKEMKKYFSSKKYLKDKKMKIIDELIADVVDISPTTYMRGINISNRIVVIDEAQNITPHVMKTIMTRLGENSKAVVLFDQEQIDDKYLDEFSNGAAYLVDRCIESEPYFCYIRAKESVRSYVAKRMGELL